MVNGNADRKNPVSPYYAPHWESDLYDSDEDALIAEGEDWTYTITPLKAVHDEIIGYTISGSSVEHGCFEFGSVTIAGKPGERT